MTHSPVESSGASRRSRLAGIGWAGVLLCVFAWAVIVWAWIGEGVGRALGASPTDPSAVITVWPIVVTVVSALVGVLAAVARRWVLLSVSVLLVIVGVVFVIGATAT